MAKVCDGKLGQRGVFGPAIPISPVGSAENTVRASSSEERTGCNTGLPMPQPQRGDGSRPISRKDVTIPLASKGYSHQDLSRRGQDAELEIVAQRAAEMAVARLTDYTAQIEGRLLVEKNDGWYQSMLGKWL